MSHAPIDVYLPSQVNFAYSDCAIDGCNLSIHAEVIFLAKELVSALVGARGALTKTTSTSVCPTVASFGCASGQFVAAKASGATFWGSLS